MYIVYPLSTIYIHSGQLVVQYYFQQAVSTFLYKMQATPQ